MGSVTCRQQSSRQQTSKVLAQEAKANAVLDFLEAPKVMKDVNLAEKVCES
jgi:hypothetical protein